MAKRYIVLIIIFCLCTLDVISQDSISTKLQPQSFRKNVVMANDDVVADTVFTSQCSSLNINNGEHRMKQYEIKTYVSFTKGILRADTALLKDTIFISEHVGKEDSIEGNVNGWESNLFAPEWLCDNYEYEWISESDKMQLIKKTYPVKETYYIHSDYPDLKIYAGIDSNGDAPCYIAKGSDLVRVLYDDNPYIDEIIWQAIMKYAYVHNIYNIKKDSYGVQQWVKSKAGLIKQDLNLLKSKSWFQDGEKAKLYEEQIALDCNLKGTTWGGSYERKHLSNNEILYLSPDKKVQVKIEYCLKSRKLERQISVVKVPW